MEDNRRIVMKNTKRIVTEDTRQIVTKDNSRQIQIVTGFTKKIHLHNKKQIVQQ